MKKLLILFVSVLSLSIIYAAGWASASGVIRSEAVNEPAAIRTVLPENSTDCPNNGENCHDGKDDCPKNKQGATIRKHGFRFKAPFPPAKRDGKRTPKTAN